MRLNLPEKIDRHDWLASLGTGGELSEELSARLESAEKMLLDAAMPKGVYRVMKLEDISREGFSIEKHLEKCHSAAVMAVTLGAGIDNLLRRTQVTDMALAVILDCGASVLTEQVCDEFEALINSETEGYKTFRFSPGYGDYPIHYQKDIIRYVDGQRKIGLTVTPDSIMVPRKSVTALIGISDEPVTGRLATCGECVLRDKCTLRKEGKFCGDR